MRALILTAIFLLIAAHAQAASPILPCTASQLSLALDDENGAFNGMSHSGTLLVLRNLGPNACSVPPFPAIAFKDAAGEALDIAVTVQGARFMHPGPVVLPPIVPPSAELTSTLRWVSGDVFDHGVCLQPATLTVSIAAESQTVPFNRTLCGQAKPAYTMTRLTPDPVYHPATTKH